jgi:cell division protein FtsI (penicillin-binding protein 3)
MDRVVASFAGYVPADRPRLVILIVVDEPKVGQYGGTIAAPAFQEIAEPALRYLGVAPSLPQRTLDLAAPQLVAFSQPERGRTEPGVPDLRGLDARAAIARAVAAGLTVRASGSGVVASQDPMPGGALPTNRSVTLMLTEASR